MTVNQNDIIKGDMVRIILNEVHIIYAKHA